MGEPAKKTVEGGWKVVRDGVLFLSSLGNLLSLGEGKSGGKAPKAGDAKSGKTGAK
jgi:hypothetical protein